MKRILLALSLLCGTALVHAGIDFDVVDDVASCLSPAAFDNLGAMSIGMWVLPASSGEGGAGTLVQKAGTSAGFTGWRLRFISTTTALNFARDYDTTDKTKETSTTVSTTAWSCIVVTEDGTAESDNVHIYINGTEASYASGVDGATTRTDDDANNVLIGNSSNSTRTFDNIIDDVAIWNTQLTAAEAAQYCSKTRYMAPQIQNDNLILYTPLDDEANGTSFDGDTAINRVGSGNNCSGDNGANNTGLAASDSPLTYP